MKNKQFSRRTRLPKRVLFVCLGNICRSPAAEGILRHIVEVNGMQHAVVVDSAGLGSWHVGELPDIRMRRHGERHGYHFDSRARVFESSDFDKFDFVVAMDDNNIDELKGKARSPYDFKKIVPIARYLRHFPMYNSVPDPYYGGDNGFELVIQMLEDACQTLYESLVADVNPNT